MVTDLRPDYRNDITQADLRKRADAYQFGGVMASRYDIVAKRDCQSLPPAAWRERSRRAIRQATLRIGGMQRADAGSWCKPIFPKTRTERGESPACNSIDRRPVRELSAARNFSARRAIAGLRAHRAIGHGSIEKCSAVKLRLVQTGLVKIRLGQIRACQIGFAAICAPRVCIRQIGPYQTGPDHSAPMSPAPLTERHQAAHRAETQNRRRHRSGPRASISHLRAVTSRRSTLRRSARVSVPPFAPCPSVHPSGRRERA